MNKFLKGLLFFSISLVLFILISGKLFNIILYPRIYSEDVFKLPAEKTILFFGDSHAMCAFNDSVIPHSFNAARNSESYFQTFQKIRILLAANPQIKTIALSYSPHNLAAQYDALILYGEIYYPLLDQESKDLMINAGNYGLVSGYSVKSSSLKNKILMLRHKLALGIISFKLNWGFPSRLEPYVDFLRSSKNDPKRLYHHPLFTLPYASTHSNLDDETINQAIDRHFYKSGASCRFSEIMTHYLKKIERLCNTYHVQLILFATPEHTKYIKRVPPCYKDYSNNLAEKMAEDDVKLKYENYSDIYLPDSLYGDGDHLNYLGNVVFSKMLVKDSIFQLN